MKTVELLARVLLGLIFLISGINYFYPFLPYIEITPASKEGLAFLSALENTNFVMPIEKSLEIFAAILLITRTAVPLALVILAPLVVNIFFYHLILSPGLPVSALIVTLMLYLTYTRRKDFSSLFRD